jgi:hypothetical protein
MVTRKKSKAIPGNSKKRTAKASPNEEAGSLTPHANIGAVAPPDPTGSCSYADTSGQILCESPVTKSYCDGKGGLFVEGDRC